MSCKHRISANRDNAMPQCKICSEYFTYQRARDVILRQTKCKKTAEYECKILVINQDGVQNRLNYEKRKEELRGKLKQLFWENWGIRMSDDY